MGCDIHSYVEKWNEGTEKWELIWGMCPRLRDECGELGIDVETYAGELLDDVDEYHSKFEEYCEHKLYIGRNYNLFAILAGVRNHTGWCSPYVSIDCPRGVPKDCSSEYRAWVDLWDVEGHSHSYFTVQELLDYDWDQEKEYRGLVGPKGFIEWKERGRPSEWAYWTGDDKDGVITNTEMEALVVSSRWPEPVRGRYTGVVWKEPHRNVVKRFFNETLPELQKLGSPDKVRMVFFFDN
jgi:hypothetical protein